MLACAQCGAPVSSEQEVCSACGAPRDTSEIHPPNESEQRRRMIRVKHRKRIRPRVQIQGSQILWAAVGIALALGFLAWFLQSMNVSP